MDEVGGAGAQPADGIAVSDPAGAAIARGLFGEVIRPARGEISNASFGDDDSFAAAICAELARAGHAGETRSDLWARALERGQVAAARSHHPRR